MSEIDLIARYGGPPTPEEFQNWIAPAAALDRLPLIDRDAWKRAIMHRLRAAEIPAAGRMGLNLELVPIRLWREWQIGDDLWITGDTTFSRGGYVGGPILFADGEEMNPPDPYESLTYLGVRFGVNEFKRSFPTATDPVAETPLTAFKGGRPRAPWWDDLWIEICCQIYRGDVIPEQQANIEKAMHAWIIANGYEAGETTVRDRARRLFKALNREDGN
jgi:hypothetical protein